MRTTLRTLEGLLLSGGHRTARRNAWTAVLADRRRATARAQAQQMLDSGGAGPTGVAGPTPEVVRTGGHRQAT
ncbi:hypothetical protein [Streptomyces oceani]|uniref:Uncharacterized protein n=1 Tax=Streptomyces oceani TaxID=1075402 RepID=A0A1E7KCT3_9ACTN|nr:hypothetical protein [Streptomyces oceani]OEV01722.1 hypothetical protein AN216_17005 [Streptomyces oceani]